MMDNKTLTKITLKIFLFLIGFWSFLGIVNAATIESTTNGGPWTINSTWIGGKIPGTNDDVIINGPVFLWSNNITIKSLVNNSTLYKFKNYDTYNLTINGDFINNGNLGGRVSSYENNFYLSVKGDVKNNGLIKILKSDVYGNIYNGINSIWTGLIYLYGVDGITVDKIIETVPGFNTEIKLFNDIRLKNSINFVGKFDINKNTIFLDEILDIYIYTVKGNGKIISNYNNGDNQTLKFNSINYLETNIENVDAGSSIGIFKGRNIISKTFGFNGIIDANIILKDGKLSFCDDSTINGNVYLENVNLYLCPNSTNHIYELNINGDLYSDGIIGSTFIYRQNFNLNIKGDFLNKGEVKETLNSINLYGNLDNLNGVINTTVYLMWDKIQDYNNYLINIKGEGQIILADGELPNGEGTMEVNNSNKYLLLNNMVNQLKNIYWKVKGEGLIFDSNWTETKCINVNGCVNIKIPLESQIPTPTNLNQYIIPATLEEREEIQVGSKIGKFQSGSGVIFEAEIDNPESKELRLNIELYKKGETTTKQNYTSDYFTNSGKVFTKILLSEGDYYWNIKIEDRDGNASEIVDFKDNGTNPDFSIFEGFEPYPYGFSFVNGAPSSGMLTGTYNIEFTYNKPFYKITEDDGRKWKIFDKAFDTRVGTGFEKGEIKRIRAYESLGLNNDITLINNGSCFGLSTLVLLKYQDEYFKSKNIPNYLEQNHNRLYTKIKNGNIYDFISDPSSTGNQNWDIYSDDLEDIFSFHLFQYNKINRKLNDDGLDKPIDILNTLKNNPDKKYILNFEWKKADGNLTGHSVIPYRVDLNRIYIYDNVVKFPFIDTEKYGILKSYEQYIEIQDNGKIIIKSWPDINEKDLTLMGLMDIEEMNNNGNKSFPIGFNIVDILYTFKGDSDFLLVDKDGNKVGYKDGNIFEQIPGARLLIPLNGNLEQNNWKQIYLPEKLENLTIEINGKVDENYDLMIAGGDYYAKLEGITTSSGQTDIFNISRENIKLNFDDTKTGSYNILVDDFQNNSTGSIYLYQLETIKEKQELNIDWNKVINNENDSINYSIDTNNDGIYDIESNFNSLPKSENETGSISGKVISSPSNAGYKVCIDSNNNSICEENIERFIVTDNTGNYKFDNLSKGSYTILQETRNNWEIIKPLDKKYTIKLNNGQNIINLNFENSKINGNKNNNK